VRRRSASVGGTARVRGAASHACARRMAVDSDIVCERPTPHQARGGRPDVRGAELALVAGADER
jgi:hypothetical protein